MTDEVHEARRNRAEQWLETLEERGRNALIDWMQTAIETMELFDAACDDLDLEHRRFCVTTNGLGTKKIFPRIPPLGNFKEQDLYIVYPGELDVRWLSICAPEGCAVINEITDARLLGRALQYVYARFGNDPRW